MQVAERGLLDLDTAVNRYLTGFQIPDIYPQPFDPSAALRPSLS
jgi:CubicO group peptidase (beta-lactamase class C family)